MCAYSSADLQLVREYDVPSPMTFKEEGGVSLSPDGTKFFAVSENNVCVKDKKFVFLTAF